MLDLGDAGDAHPHGVSDAFLREAQLLAGFGELVPAGLGEQLAYPGLDLGGGDTGGVKFPLESFPSPAGCAWACSLPLVFGGVVEVQLLGERNVVAVPPLPVAGLVAAELQQGRPGGVEREDDPVR